MRKLIALILAVVMMASMSVVAFATPIVDGDSKLADQLAQGENRDLLSDDETVDVIYDVRMGYEVTIPGDFNLQVNDNVDGTTYGTGEGTVSINMAKLPGSKKLIVTASGANAKETAFGNWTLKVDGGTQRPVGYKIKVTNNDSNQASLSVADLTRDTGVIVAHDSNSDDPVATATPRTADLDITTDKTSQAGYFEDQITFKTAIVDSPAQS